MPELFRYDLCGYLASLFQNNNILNCANKPVLADSLWSKFGDLHPDPYDEYHYVLDGGALLHRIPWPKGKTYDEM